MTSAAQTCHLRPRSPVTICDADRQTRLSLDLVAPAPGARAMSTMRTARGVSWWQKGQDTSSGRGPIRSSIGRRVIYASQDRLSGEPASVRSAVERTGRSLGRLRCVTSRHEPTTTAATAPGPCLAWSRERSDALHVERAEVSPEHGSGRSRSPRRLMALDGFIARRITIRQAAAASFVVVVAVADHDRQFVDRPRTVNMSVRLEAACKPTHTFGR